MSNYIIEPAKAALGGNDPVSGAFVIGTIVAVLIGAGLFVLGIPFEVTLIAFITVAFMLSQTGWLPPFVSWIAFAVGGIIVGFAILKFVRR